MKILIISPTGGYAGIDVCLDNLISNIDKSKFEIVVIFPNDAFLHDKFENLGVKCYSLPLKWWFHINVSNMELLSLIYDNFDNIIAIKRIIIDEKVDMVLSNTTVSLDGCIASALCETPHLFFMHAKFVDNIYKHLLPQTKKMIYKLMGYMSSEIVCCSETLCNSMKEYTENVSYINNGIDTHKFPFSIKSLKESSSLNILMAGHFNANKQHDFVLKALKNIKDHNPQFLSKIHYTGIGTAEKEYLMHLSALVQEYGLEQNVSFEEFSDNMPKKLTNYNLYVNSSVTETLPLSVMEAMSSGLPVVATPTDGAKLIIENGISGFICETPEKMASCFCNLLEDPALLPQLSMEARKRIENKFSIDNFVQKFEALFERVIMSSNRKENMYKNIQDIFSSLIYSQKIINILVVYPQAAAPTFMIAAKKPLEYLATIHNINYICKDLPEVTEQDITDNDLIFCIRYYHDAAHKLLEKAHQSQKGVIWYIDDNYNALVVNGKEIVHKQNHNSLYEYMFKKSDYVIVNNQQIYELGKQFTRNIAFLPVYQDITRSQYISNKPNSVVRFGFMGTLNRDGDFTCVVTALERILEKYGELIEVEFIGYYPSGLTRRKNIRHFDFINDYNAFRNFFESREWDFALAPLNDTQFNRSKTNNKYREYSSYAIPAIYSNVSTYSGCITNYVNGIIINNSVDEWYKAIEELITSKELRKKLGESALKDIQINYNIINYAKPLFDIFVKVASESNNIIQMDAMLSMRQIGDIPIAFVNKVRNRITYRFTSPCDKLKMIGIIFACIGSPQGTVSLKVYDSHRELRSSSVNLSSIIWNTWTYFTFSEIKNSYMKLYKLELIFDYSDNTDYCVGVFEEANRQSYTTYLKHRLGLNQSKSNLLYIDCH